MTTLVDLAAPATAPAANDGGAHDGAPASAPLLPERRPDLLIRPIGDNGIYVVKDPHTGEYFSLGAQEQFLLVGLDGRQTADELRAAFELRFGEPLGADDIAGFVALASAQGFLRTRATTGGPGAARTAATQIDYGTDAGVAAPGPSSAALEPPPRPKQARQSLLFWRKRAFDPDRLFNWLEPRIRFVWTPAFVVASCLFVVAAAAVLWANRRELVTHFADLGAARWETWVLAWVTLVLATTLHEFAHGLTCKHFGGEVHEVGFLMLFFIPCLYCNVSDAWLFREKSKRLWVALAGGYCDLIIWAAAVFVWRLTPQDSFPNYLAWVIVTVASARNLFNFNPLLKLDGYYLLSDAMEIPNLRQRAWDRFMSAARWLLWGGARPGAEPYARFLTLFGLASWAFSVAFLCLMLLGYLKFLGNRWGPVGFAAVAVLALALSPHMFVGLSSGEFRTMMTTRRKRVALWVLALGVLAVAASLIQYEDRATGAFEVRSAKRAELRAPTAAFLREVYLQPGEHTSGGAQVARLEVPDLASRTIQKHNEVREAEAKLTLAAAGPPTPSEDRVSGMKANRARKDAAASELLRLREELAYLHRLEARQCVRTPVAGVMVTPHADERIGEYFKEGDLICVVEDCADLEVEVRLPEEEVQWVRPGQAVELKARALPFDTLRATVLDVAPVAQPGKDGAQGTVTVYCRLDAAPAAVRPAMTGVARIACGRRPAGTVFARRVLRYVRTEFWW
jgi:putative peptide zinc metalloprotease protein